MKSTGLEVDRIGEIVGGKYRIVRLLAEGGMGVVYEAHHTVVRRRFAIKLLRRDLAERRDILTRFQREAQSAGALENDNVAAAVDFGITDDGTAYIVMELLVGESLGALLRRVGPLPISRAADLVSQACRGVGAAHAIGIVHRDLKPDNLFVARRDDGTDLIKILDFGVAKLQDADEASLATQTGTIIGTAAYMSPEQARGEKTIDRKTDVYALGAILYELVSQRKPHPGDSQNAILHHIATHPAVPLESVQDGLPPAVVEAVARALASDLTSRTPSVGALAESLAPFARREAWPPPEPVESDRRPGALTSTVLAGAVGPDVAPTGEVSAVASTVDDRGPLRAAPARRPPGRSRLAIAGAMALVAVAIAGAALRRKAAPPPDRPARRPTSAILAPGTRFLNAEPEPGAIQQIEALLKTESFHDAALLDAMVATPSAIWLMTGSPQQVENDVRDVATRAARQDRVPVLVPYNHPFHECTGYGASGAADTAVYKAWLDGFASGIGNERAVVLLEPNSLGLIPYGKRLDGTEDSCRPTIAGNDGKRAPPPGATAAERYRELNEALDTLALKAPNAAVYLDGTHSGWLPVGEIAYRLRTAGVDRAAGFYLNVGNYQPTRRLVQYGTWVAKCLEHARAAAPEADPMGPYRTCATPPDWADPDNDGIWADVDAWYATHVDPSLAQPSNRVRLTHFVINTNRNGRGPLAVVRYASPPYNQPAAVLDALRNGSWCMPPGRGLGLRPTADTGVSLVDAYLWTDRPGISVASCDIAGGARAWDYAKYNPWGLSGDAQDHFDPLWGMILPPTGAWFPAEALELARNANPSLDEGRRPDLEAAGRPAGHPGDVTPPSGHPASGAIPGSRVSRRQPPNLQFPMQRAALAPGPGAAAFDSANPYR